MAPPISHKYKCIFVHIPKAAGTTIQTSEIFSDQRQATGEYVGGHLTAQGFQKQFPEQFNNYFKFTFVRNPFDRLVSAFIYLSQGGGGNYADREIFEKYLAYYNKNFKRFCIDFLSEENVQKIIHLKPQVDFIYNDRSKPLVDFIGKVENFTTDFNLVCQRIGFPTPSHLNQKRKSKRKDYSTYYSSKTRKIVEKIYKSDLEAFNYSFELNYLRIISKEIDNLSLSSKDILRQVYYKIIRTKT